jgi:hypothetical protein
MRFFYVFVFLGLFSLKNEPLHADTHRADPPCDTLVTTEGQVLLVEIVGMDSTTVYFYECATTTTSKNVEITLPRERVRHIGKSSRRSISKHQLPKGARPLPTDADLNNLIDKQFRQIVLLLRFSTLSFALFLLLVLGINPLLGWVFFFLSMLPLSVFYYKAIDMKQIIRENPRLGRDAVLARVKQHTLVILGLLLSASFILPIALSR